MKEVHRVRLVLQGNTHRHRVLHAPIAQLELSRPLKVVHALLVILVNIHLSEAPFAQTVHPMRSVRELGLCAKVVTNYQAMEKVVKHVQLEHILSVETLHVSSVHQDISHSRLVQVV